VTKKISRELTQANATENRSTAHLLHIDKQHKQLVHKHQLHEISQEKTTLHSHQNSVGKQLLYHLFLNYNL